MTNVTEHVFDDVRVAGIGLPTTLGTIQGLGFCLASEPDAHRFFEFVQRYIVSAATRRSFDLSCTTTPGPPVLELSIAVDDQCIRLVITDIDLDIIGGVVDTLASFLYFPLLAGHVTEDGRLSLLDPSSYHLYRRELLVDGDLITGSGAWPSPHPLAADAHNP